MISTSEFKNGVCFKYDGDLWMIREFQHVKPGKGGAFVRTKLVKLRTGNLIEKTFRAGEKFEDVRLDDKKMKFLYSGGDEYYFMDNENYEQISVNEEKIKDIKGFLKEDMDVILQMVDNEIINVTLPSFVVLKIVSTDPGLKGDTVSGASKPATLETGAVIQVPLFISEGETVKIDTRTGQYSERA